MAVGFTVFVSRPIRPATVLTDAVSKHFSCAGFVWLLTGWGNNRMSIVPFVDISERSGKIHSRTIEKGAVCVMELSGAN